MHSSGRVSSIRLLCILFMLSAFSSIISEGGTFSFTLENDMFYRTDRHYTHGVRFSYIPGEDAGPPGWAVELAKILPWMPEEGNYHHGYAFGQSIFTPADLSADKPSPHDRPYAGFLYGAIGLGIESDHQLDQFVLVLGMIGPSSLAGRTQSYVHDLFDWRDPEGWDAQLKDEIGVMMVYQRTWRRLETTTLLGNSIDLSRHFGFSLGNVFTYGNAGVTMRYGRDLPDDYGPPRIQPGQTGSSAFSPLFDFSWYFFISIEGRAVARNIFLDGNTFRNSHSVKKELLVADLQFGLVIDWARIRISYAHIIRSKEFRNQELRDEYGAFTIYYKF